MDKYRIKESHSVYRITYTAQKYCKWLFTWVDCSNHPRSTASFDTEKKALDFIRDRKQRTVHTVKYIKA